MTDVLLASAFYLGFDPKQERIGRPYPPLGTLFAAAVLQREGFDVGVFDAMLAPGVAAFAERLEQDNPRVVVLYEDSFNWLTKMCLSRMRRAAAEMIRAARDRGCTVACNGSDATDRPEHYLDAGSQAVLLGEGESTLVELLPLMQRQEADLSSVCGLALSNGAGRTRRTAPRERLLDLDILPPPAWELVDLESYRRFWKSRHGYFSLNLATTRGCPYRCNWCAKPIFGRRYSSRSPESVVQEMERLRDLVAPDHYWFADDIFGLKPGWVERFGALVQRGNLRTPFTVQCRPDLIVPSFVDGLRAAGCTTAWLGAESGSQTILDAMDKGTTLEQIRSARRRLRDAGIECAFFLQFGYPGETMREIEMTMDMVRSLMPDDIGISVSYPLPGTPFYERVRSELGDKRNWVDSGDLDMLFAGEFAPAFYRVLLRRVHAEFRTRKAWRALGRHGSRPWRLRPRHIRLALRAARHGRQWLTLRSRLKRLQRERNPRRIRSEPVSRAETLIASVELPIRQTTAS